jgi:hypothetical protein
MPQGGGDTGHYAYNTANESNHSGEFSMNRHGNHYGETHLIHDRKQVIDILEESKVQTLNGRSC